MIKLDRNTSHKNVMYIREFFIDRDEPAHLVDQVIHLIEGIGDEIVDGANGMDWLFVADTLALPSH